MARGDLFDAIDAIGGKILELGQDIRRSAVHFPATSQYVIDDLKLCENICKAAIERITKAGGDADGVA